MTRPALIAALRAEADRDLAAVRDSARDEVEQLREKLAAAREAERTRLDEEIAAAVRRVEEQGAEEAGRKARESGARAALALAERLLELARAELPGLAGTRREALFEALARELPRRQWQGVRVNPADAALAARHFPDADVQTEPSISGGLEVHSEDGRIEVSNTLETRLANAWPDLLPTLLGQLVSRSPADGGAA